MKLFISNTIAILLFCQLSYGQKILVSSYNNINSSIYNIEYVIGQDITRCLINDNSTVIPGILQPNYSISTFINPNNLYYTKVYPNPFKDIINIKQNQIYYTTLEVFNGTGQKVYLTQNLSMDLQIHSINWSSGIYIIRLSSSTHKEVKTIKIIKQ